MPSPDLDPLAQKQLGAATIPEAFYRTVSEHSDRLALKSMAGGPELTWSDYRQRSERIAGALAARGVGRGETVATMVVNRPEFFLIDTATLIAGGTPFAIYNTSPAEEIAYILSNAAPLVFFTEAQFEAVVRTAVDETGANTEVVVLAADGPGDLEAFEQSCPDDFDAAASWQTVRSDDVALLCYTSGTTGRPKGVQLTHRNLMACWYAFVAAVPSMARLERLLTYLPSAHLADRIYSLYPAIHTGASVTCVPDRKQIGAAMVATRPSAFLGVPRIWEKLRSALAPMVSGTPDPETAQKIREKIGLDEGSVAWTGAAPLDVEVLEFFDSIGIPILEGYGMTEMTAVISANRIDDRRNGTVGPALPGVEIRIADDGEILVRGDSLTIGYRNLPEKTAEAIDAEGWLHTGDIGSLDEDGYLTILDRKKELIVNSAGKNIAPAQIENALRTACHVLGPVAAIGDRRPYITALLSLDPDEARNWANNNGLADAELEELAQNPELRKHIDAAVREANQRLARTSQVKRFTVLPDVWLPETGLVTPTLKLKRKAVTERYTGEINRMYETSD